MTIQIISLGIALLAVIVSPFITYHITKMNLEFQFRTMNQEKWISKLETVALEFLNYSHQMFEKYPTLLVRVERSPELLHEVNNEIDKMLDAMNNSMIRLQLLLDDSKQLQKEIIEKSILMKKILLKRNLDEETTASLSEAHDTIVRNLKVIFEDERKKIKKLFS